jgi:hypothetical protein
VKAAELALRSHHSSNALHTGCKRHSLTCPTFALCTSTALKTASRPTSGHSSFQRREGPFCLCPSPS